MNLAIWEKKQKSARFNASRFFLSALKKYKLFHIIFRSIISFFVSVINVEESQLVSAGIAGNNVEEVTNIFLLEELLGEVLQVAKINWIRTWNWTKQHEIGLMNVFQISTTNIILTLKEFQKNYHKTHRLEKVSPTVRVILEASRTMVTLPFKAPVLPLTLILSWRNFS